MTATDELRRLLDERGVEWDADDEIMDDGSISQVTYWYSNDIEWSADGRDEYLAFDAVQLITPEQAIAATLGGGYQGFWTHDGTLHIELPKLPESILVRLPDTRNREVHSARVWQYTLNDADATRERQGVVGTCKADETETIKCWVKCKDEPSTEHVELIHVMECNACGGTYEYVNGSYEYCPRCRAKVIG